MSVEQAPQGPVSCQRFKIWANAHFRLDFNMLPHLTDMDISANSTISAEHSFLPWKLLIGTMKESSSDPGSKVYAYVTDKMQEIIVFKQNGEQISRRHMDLINLNVPFCDVNTNPLTTVGRQRMDTLIKWYFISFLPSKGKDSLIDLNRWFWFSFEKGCFHIGRAASKRAYAAEAHNLRAAVYIGSSTKVSVDREIDSPALVGNKQPGSKRKFKECDASVGHLDTVELQHSMRQGYYHLLSQAGLEFEKAQTDNINLTQENSKMKTQNEQLTRSITAANAKIKEVTDEAEQIKTHLCKQKASLEVEIASIKQESTETKTKNLKLINELDDIYKQIKKSKAEIKTVNMSLAVTQSSLDTWKAKAQTEEMTIAGLQLLIQQRERENFDLNKENVRIEKQFKSEANRVSGTMLESIQRDLSFKIEEAEEKAIVAMKEAQKANAKKDVVELELRKCNMWFERILPLPN